MKFAILDAGEHIYMYVSLTQVLSMNPLNFRRLYCYFCAQSIRFRFYKALSVLSQKFKWAELNLLLTRNLNCGAIFEYRFFARKLSIYRSFKFLNLIFITLYFHFNMWNIIMIYISKMGEAKRTPTLFFQLAQMAKIYHTKLIEILTDE